MKKNLILMVLLFTTMLVSSCGKDEEIDGYSQTIEDKRYELESLLEEWKIENETISFLVNGEEIIQKSGSVYIDDNNFIRSEDGTFCWHIRYFMGIYTDYRPMLCFEFPYDIIRDIQ